MSEKKSGTAGYKIFDLAESARMKGMWAGALERTNIPGLSGIYNTGEETYEIKEIKNEHTPAILKIIDEGLVNASDHKKEHENAKNKKDRVTHISLEFDNGRITIENDGPGIPIIKHEDASKTAGRDVYIPEVAFSFFLSGKNMEKSPDSVKGGINGIGGKLINVNSSLFSIETVSDKNVYFQTFRNRMRVREDPEILTTRSAKIENKKPHTRITFTPAYSELGYSQSPPEEMNDIKAWCRWRMFLLAAYVGPKTTVIFNGEKCPTTSAKSLAALAVSHDPEAIIMSCTAKASKQPYASHPWDIAVAIVPSSKKFSQLSVINGVHCAKGSHITYIKKLINDAVGTKLSKATKSKSKKTSVADTCKQVYLVIVGALPGADWGGQRKDVLQVAESKLQPYSISPMVLGKIASTIADTLLQTTERGVKNKKKRIEADKYTGARKAGTKDSAKCSLLAAEGDSAITLLRAGLTLSPPKNKTRADIPSFDNFGVISLGGVIMNAMKKITEVNTPGGNTVIVRSEQLRNNKVLKALVDVLGLDFTCKYETDDDISKLRYGSVIIATDQDLDGTGKILPLVLVWFHVFWPNLIAKGYIKRYMTPVIRAYSKDKKTMKEFYYENEFDHWVYEQGGEENVNLKYNIKYYKGLATHDEDEVKSMFSNFHKSVYTFTLDDTAKELFEIYFGDRPSLRKTALATPVAYLSYEEAQEIHHSRIIPCSIQLRVDAKAYKLDDIERKIPGIADGIPIARRKVLAGSLRRFANSNREVKVFQLGGYIAEHMFYHHGDASLNGTIIGMAQRYPGALKYPYLSGIGQFGSRHFGGDDAGSPRYINVRLASNFAKAMFPAEDTCMLPHVFEDGERAQPKYFVGVLPTPLIESFEIPSEGWRHKSFARDIDDIINLTRAYASGDLFEKNTTKLKDMKEIKEKYPLNVSIEGYGKTLTETEHSDLIRPYKGYLHSFGWYSTEGKNIIYVEELPIRKSTASFLKDLEKPSRAKYIDEVDDYSSDSQINIRIKITPGSWDAICSAYGTSEIDPFEDFLMLRISLKPFLNYYDCTTGGVLEFDDDYYKVFFHWAPLRRNLYRQRLEREYIILKLKNKLESDIVRYIGIAHKLDLAKKENENDANRALEENNFTKFDSNLLYSPRFTPTNEIEHLVMKGINVSYNHILNLRERDLVATAKANREKKIEDNIKRIKKVEIHLREKPFAGASIWNKEIDQVASAIEKGIMTRWRF